MSQTRILALVGSLRSASINRQLAEAAAQTAPEGVEIDIYAGLGDIPFYNEDIDVPGEIPAAAQALRDAVAAADGLLLFAPEYNGTIPAALKNVIDWASRPFGAGSIKDKAAAVVSASISQNAAKWSHADTVKALGVAGAKVVESAHLHFGTIGQRFAEAHPREDAEALTALAATVHELVEATRAAVNA
ncbi:NAD(P)H-dependent oxidoreductase [Nocardia terpenica]|uniref:FMN reductase n=1 Tax=Nocardia terpenica TaxID=455432 RepID=A0A164JE12_9NOCA|nr:NAD(P)H-dependent oxidoreductase [Nocardia terpenica]KZM70310.1 FMN reductase [Nocardia terpenica]MBF6063964.1 NAD(P)H-dependent oxidoreductase [Nocardia terpenica]MBF6107800.1 NAD(P)H-dependent oxidoreductase [Nocardia terpenica]MBF6114868.1 NAD(P)H-dependent oxidoreductase [Nocardia terpenica]MBF6121145.1 NAD(P)H-dependent oxidoreductase [Nocardia terpenica]